MAVARAKRPLNARKSVFITEILRSYGLPENIVKSGKKGLRYETPLERGILWYWFSKYIRERDKDKPCISCHKHTQTLQAGHFVPTGNASWDGFVFDELNVNGECPQCNAWDEMHLFGYAKGLDERYGIGTADKLREKYEEYKKTAHKNWNKAVLQEKIALYKQKLSDIHTVENKL